VVYVVAGSVHVEVLLPFAAGSFVYIALVDLVPELTTSKAPHDKAILAAGFAAGLLLLLGLAVVG
jgi:zinc and cadmium transporter